ncbi:MAG: flavin reductase, partial [Candidatus Brocadiaceae bacterium]
MLHEIDPMRFALKCFDAWATRWMLLSSGDFTEGSFNSMTVAWGSLGIMWGRPFAMVVVRPTRYTYEFMESSDNFTLCLFPPEYEDTLLMLGSKSGRDTDKIAESGLTPVAAAQVSSPCYEEAELVIECRKIYFDDFEPERFLAD